VATNDSAAGRQQNRRVELIFSNDQGQFASNR
jgi:flagellar motor protein MotB